MKTKPVKVKNKSEFTCGICKKTKDIAESYRKKYHTYCILCERKLSRESNWRFRNIKDLDKARELWETVKVCAICNIDKNLNLDHNHITGEIRGILCFSCNAAIGLLKDNKDFCLKAAEYLGKE